MMTAGCSQHNMVDHQQEKRMALLSVVEGLDALQSSQGGVLHHQHNLHQHLRVGVLGCE